MALTKITYLLKQPTAFLAANSQAQGPIVNQLFGWSESWYVNGDVVVSPSTITIAKAVADERVKLLANEAWIYGIRIQRVDPTGASRKYRIFKTGQAGLACDDPENCLAYNARSQGGHANWREITLRGVPDARIEKGEFTGNDAYRNALRAFFKALNDNGYGFRAIDKTQETKKILTIDAGGLVSMAENFGFAFGDQVQVLRTMAAGHRQKGHKTFVKAPIVPNVSLTLVDWPHGNCKGGTLRKVVTPVWRGIELTDFEIISPEIANRDTGGPSDSPRGRQSAKYQ